MLNSFCADSSEGFEDKIVLCYVWQWHVFPFQYWKEIFYWFLSYLPTWYIDNPFYTHGIERIKDKSNIGENILDFFAFIELHSSEYSIRYILTYERFFDQSWLSIRTIEYGKFWIGIWFSFANRICNEICFMLLIESFKYLDFFSDWIWGEECFLELIGIVFYDCIGSIDNCLSGTIILFEINDLGFWIVFLKWEYILNICTTPRIDSLPIISNNTEIVCSTCKNPDYLILEKIGILIFIYHKILKPRMKIFSYFLNIENLTKEKKEIIKIECIILFELSNVISINLKNYWFDIWVYRCWILRWGESLPFCSRNHRVNTTRIAFFFIDIFLLHNIFDNLQTIVTVIDDEVFSVTDAVDKHTKKKCCRWMECSYHRKSWFSKWINTFWIDSELYSNSFSHLFCGFVGKCHTKDRTRFYMLFLNHWNNTFSNSMCFTWSCSGIDEKWTIDGFDSNSLFWIEFWHAEDNREKTQKSEREFWKKTSFW